jgi:hypothetical protein
VIATSRTSSPLLELNGMSKITFGLPPAWAEDGVTDSDASTSAWAAGAARQATARAAPSEEMRLRQVTWLSGEGVGRGNDTTAAPGEYPMRPPDFNRDCLTV